MRKDYIGWTIGVIGILLTIYFANQNLQYRNNLQQIHNEAKVIQQYITNNNYNLPSIVVEAVDSIAIASGTIVRFEMPSKDR